MPKTLTISLPKEYPKLIENIRSIVTKTQESAKKALALITINSYWQIGEALHQTFHTPSQLLNTLPALTQDLSFDHSQLKRFYTFYSLWPDGIDVEQFPNVTWSHYKYLFSIESDEVRDFYLEQSQENNWPVRMLSQKIKDNAFAQSMLEESSSKKQKMLLRSTNALHIYKCEVHRIVDGDTMIVDLDLGFDVWVRKRLRLRGLDAEELGHENSKKQKLAQKAKAFLDAVIPAGTTIVMQTFQVDLHGRFICDVFYLPNETGKEKIFNKGKFLNQELLASGLARKT